MTPSPEPQSAPAGEADRSADFDSFLDDFDPSDGDLSERVEDASAWLDGSSDYPALSPDAANARKTTCAGNDSASSFDFATPEFVASASRGLEARVGASSRDASRGCREDARRADADVRAEVDGIRARLSFEDGDAGSSPRARLDASSDVSTDVDADVDVLSTLDVLASPGAGGRGAGAGGPPETPAPLRGLGVGPDEWAREALRGLGVAGDATADADAETGRPRETGVSDAPRDGSDDDAKEANASAPATTRRREAASVLPDAEAEIRETRGAAAKTALEEETGASARRASFERRPARDDALAATASETDAPPRASRAEEEASDRSAPRSTAREEEPRAEAGETAAAVDERAEAPPAAPLAALAPPREASATSPSAGTRSSPALETPAVSLERGEEVPTEADEEKAPLAAARGEAARAAEAYLAEARRAERDATRKIAAVESSFADAETAVAETLADARSAATASEEADAIAALEREAEAAEAAARAMLAAAARKRDAVLAAAAEAAKRVHAPASREDDEGYLSSERASSASETSLVPSADAPAGSPRGAPERSADLASVSRSALTTRQALDRMKQARTHRRETLLRRVALERDAVAAELERRARAGEKDTVAEPVAESVSRASLASPSPPGRAAGRAASLGSPRRVEARDAVARTRENALEAANAKRVARLERERETAARASPSLPASRSRRPASSPLGRSSLEPPGYARAIASPATSASASKTNRSTSNPRGPDERVASPFAHRGSAASPRPSPARRPWGSRAPAGSAEAGRRRASAPETVASSARRGEGPPPRDARSPLSSRVPNVGSRVATGGSPARATPKPGRARSEAAPTTRVSPLFAARLTDARASLTKLSRASGAAEALADDESEAIVALADAGFDLDELASVWTRRDSPAATRGVDVSLGAFVDEVSSRSPEAETEGSLARRAVDAPTDSSRGAAAVGHDGVSPSDTDASTPMSELERRFMASYALPARTPESVARGRAATAAAKRAAARALDAVEAEDDDDFERFFAKYRAETEAAAAKGRAMLRGNVPATPETPASEAARRAAAAAALDASPGKTVAAARLAAAAARRETEDFTAARPVSRLARGASARA